MNTVNTRGTNIIKATKKLPIVRLQDYMPPAFACVHHELEFNLHDDAVCVAHRQQIVRIPVVDDYHKFEQEKHAVLDGENLKLLLICIDGKELTDEQYQYDGAKLTLFDVSDNFELYTQVTLQPQLNTQLSGLYRSRDIYCTQCEAEGFRRISFAFDRPDVLSTFRVRIEADENIPVLLSNGILEESGKLPAARHYALWRDPHPKPSYLFALVAGDLAHLQRRLITPRGKDIMLYAYSEKKFIAQCQFALQALENAICWDEERFGFSYDLERFNIVAISDFNSGAMENKSLNIFNSCYMLADDNTASDHDYRNIEAVIAHEYFHNWTGNRITCRDWFQLSLKEGLTVFREQLFCSDRGNASLERVKAVKFLRNVQFSEDSSPLAHAVRPSEYSAIDNFYTATVYEKGAEIIRMMHTILGEEKFQRGMRLYVERHDGKAAQIEDLLLAMSDVSDYRFDGNFFHWYNSKGTPKVTFFGRYNRREQRFTLTATQEASCVSPPQNLVIPIVVSFLYRNGARYYFSDGSTQRTLILERSSDSWHFENAAEPLIAVLMEGFSAPINYCYRQSDAELALIAENASDGYARYHAISLCYFNLFKISLADAQCIRDAVPRVIDLMRNLLKATDLNEAEKALLLSFPNLNTLLGEISDRLDMENILKTYRRLTGSIALKMRRAYTDYLADSNNQPPPPQYNIANAGKRSLRALAMNIVATYKDNSVRARLYGYFANANCMSERLNALKALTRHNDDYKWRALNEFLQQYQDYPLVVDKWFAVQAIDETEGAFERISALTAHPLFDIGNPNRFRALVLTFANENTRYFHAKDGSGYQFVAAQICRIASSNARLSARMLNVFATVVRMDETRRAQVKHELDKISQLDEINIDIADALQRLSVGFAEEQGMWE